MQSKISGLLGLRTPPHPQGAPSSSKISGLLGLNLNNGKDRARIAGRVAPACRALGVPRATFYRVTGPLPHAAPSHACPGPEGEREHVLALSSPRFVDRSPAEVVATLLDALCSERAWPRASRCANDEIRSYTKPELVATAPNETWSWDITRLLPKRWTYVRVARHLQPICGRVDGRRTGELGAGCKAHRANLSSRASNPRR